MLNPSTSNIGPEQFYWLSAQGFLFFLHGVCRFTDRQWKVPKFTMCASRNFPGHATGVKRLGVTVVMVLIGGIIHHLHTNRAFFRRPGSKAGLDR